MRGAKGRVGERCGRNGAGTRVPTGRSVCACVWLHVLVCFLGYEQASRDGVQIIATEDLSY